MAAMRGRGTRVMKIRELFLAIVLAALTAAPAAASTYQVEFSATNFTAQPDGSPNPAKVEGSFLIHFNPKNSYFDETSGITFQTLNLTVDSPFAFNFYPTAVGGSFQIGG